MKQEFYRRSYLALMPSAVILSVVLWGPVASAQFVGCSDESDGPLDFSLEAPGTEIIFDPRLMGLDQDEDNVFHFTTITIPEDVTVRLLGSQFNMLPVYWCASGAVVIDGTIDLSGGPGHMGLDFDTDRFPSQPGPGGFIGGIGQSGQFSDRDVKDGTGPGAGKIGTTTFAGGGAGYAVKGQGPPNGVGPDGGPAYGNSFLLPLLGGSGGGGGFGTLPNNKLSPFGGGGAAGRGAILIASAQSIAVNGSILANGGSEGRAGPGGGSASGGGGSGGSIYLKAPSITGDGILHANVGPGGLGNSGSVGRIRLEAPDLDFLTDNTNPIPTTGFPTPVFLPQNVPMIRVTEIEFNSETAAVPPNPMGNIDVADVPIDVDMTIEPDIEATVKIEARNIPEGTVAQVYLFSEGFRADQIVDSTPLQSQGDGTLTATADVILPPGFSRAYARAKWAMP